MNTKLKITYDRSGNIKTLSTPYDNEDVINEPLNTPEKEYNNKVHSTLVNMFKGFSNAYLNL